MELPPADRILPDGRATYRPPTAAAVLGCSDNTIRRAIKRGDLEGLELPQGKKTEYLVTVDAVIAELGRLKQLGHPVVVDRPHAAADTPETTRPQRNPAADADRAPETHDTTLLLQLAHERQTNAELRVELAIATARATHAEAELARARQTIVHLTAAVAATTGSTTTPTTDSPPRTDQ